MSAVLTIAGLSDVRGRSPGCQMPFESNTQVVTDWIGQFLEVQAEWCGRVCRIVSPCSRFQKGSDSQTVSFLTHQIVAVADCHCCIAFQFLLERFDPLAASISEPHERYMTGAFTSSVASKSPNRNMHLQWQLIADSSTNSIAALSKCSLVQANNFVWPWTLWQMARRLQKSQLADCKMLCQANWQSSGRFFRPRRCPTKDSLIVKTISCGCTAYCSGGLVDRDSFVHCCHCWCLAVGAC